MAPHAPSKIVSILAVILLGSVNLFLGVPLAYLTLLYGIGFSYGVDRVFGALGLIASLSSLPLGVALLRGSLRFSKLPRQRLTRLGTWTKYHHVLAALALLPAAFSDNPKALVLWLPLLGVYAGAGLWVARRLIAEALRREALKSA
jgi:hypothetical protein